MVSPSCPLLPLALQKAPHEAGVVEKGKMGQGSSFCDDPHENSQELLKTADSMAACGSQYVHRVEGKAFTAALTREKWHEIDLLLGLLSQLRSIERYLCGDM